MTRRVFALILACLFLLPVYSLAELDEEELYIEEWIDTDDPEDTAVLVETDGSKAITITCTGDFTIGGDNYHRKGKKFYDELKKHGDDISFTMQNVREIFKQDDLTLVNFEGTLTDTKYVPDNKRYE
jgi:poly-gamma-glutamate synthesis protein (capsule biosynthesis protein)